MEEDTNSRSLNIINPLAISRWEANIEAMKIDIEQAKQAILKKNPKAFDILNPK